MKISNKIMLTEKKKSHAIPLMYAKNAKYIMRLFMAGAEPNSVIARKNLLSVCSNELKGDCQLEVIDVFKDVSAAFEENIVVAPALVIYKPKKVKIFGNLQDKQKLLLALEIR